MKKILVPCDFSDTARQAYKFALDIASANAGEVIVLKIIDLTPIYIESLDSNPYYVNTMSILAELEQEAKMDFENLKKHNGTANVPVTFVVEKGIVSQAILKHIHEQNADLVVMGTHGASGLKEFLIGSNTEKIVRTAPVPVFAVHRATPVSGIKNIVFPTTLDLTQNMLANKVKDLQVLFNAKLHILYVKTPTDPTSEKELKISLDNFAGFYGFENFTTHITHEYNEQDGILKFASRTPHSIVAMATHGHTGLNHFVMGSIAEDIVNHAHETIWTYSFREDQ